MPHLPKKRKLAQEAFKLFISGNSFSDAEDIFPSIAPYLTKKHWEELIDRIWSEEKDPFFIVKSIVAVSTQIPKSILDEVNEWVFSIKDSYKNHFAIALTGLSKA